MELETRRLLIRAFAPDDAEGLQAILGDAEVMEHCEPAYCLEKTRRFLTEFCIAKQGAVAAVEKKSGRLVGYILFCPLEAGVYEIGWFFRRDVWRQGYAYEACRAVMDDAFRSRRARRIFAGTADGVKSVGLMKKLGMRFEGTETSAAADSGAPVSLYLYGISHEDWAKAKKDFPDSIF